MYKKVLVTGGAGYIGSHTASALLAAGHEVVVLDSLIKGHRAAVPSGARFIQGDVGDRKCLDHLFGSENIEAVLHFAAFIEAGESMKSPEIFFQNNTARTLTLLEAMLAHGVMGFVFSSTAAVYGAPEYSPIDEDHPKAPTNAYGASKLEVERVLEWLVRLRGLGATSLRYFNASGCSVKHGEDHRPETHLIPLLIEVAMERRPVLKLFGRNYPTPDGTCVRDYVHVEDLASAHVMALKTLRPGERRVYNLGNGRGFSNLEVIEAARKVIGHPIAIEDADPRPGDPAFLVASSEKARRELGWTPRIPGLEDIIQSAWTWRTLNPQGYPTVDLGLPGLTSSDLN
jgi:UDP-glucose 4-epimerase